jgi:hypothetical protein
MFHDQAGAPDEFTKTAVDIGTEQCGEKIQELSENRWFCRIRQKFIKDHYATSRFEGSQILA